jgi:hypothetical protein
MPEAADICIAVGAQRRGIDGAEHSAILMDVMAEGCTHPFDAAPWRSR